MKSIFALISILFTIQTFGNPQSNKFEKIQHEQSFTIKDTTRVRLLIGLCTQYKFTRPDSAIFYGNRAVSISDKINYPKGKIDALTYMILANIAIGNEAKALELNLQAIKIAEKNNLHTRKAMLFQILGRIYKESHNYEKALNLSRQSMIIFDSVQYHHFSAMVRSDIGDIYILNDKLDSAQFYCQMSYDMAVKHENLKMQYYSLPFLGKIQQLKGNDSLALIYYSKCLKLDVQNYLYLNPNLAIAKIYKQINKPDSSIYYAKQSLDIAQDNGFYANIIEASNFISIFYEKSDPVVALKYFKISTAYKDSLYNFGKLTALENFTDFDEQERQNEIEMAKIEYQNKLQLLWIFSITGVLLSALFVAFILFRNNKNKQKANKLLEATLNNLKSTQTQLIHSEKMASLGELTAGIAHEIQNPLNFVNNFSEVSGELVEELKDERSKLKAPLPARQAERDEGLEEEILDDLKQNLQKINHHGQRASGIVKGMLEHSRTGSGEKELTDINKLADEYLRLSYHGLRAKDKSFNADFKTDFDESLPKVKVITQDLGRVILNLINNAFYAVSSKALPVRQAGLAKEDKDYKPTVTVATRKIGNKIEISVKDNGAGIPEDIKEKIFQPFFTTKPTGSGTGLGLSMSYDIITKGHGGELELTSNAGEGAEFIIEIPDK